MKWLRKIYKVIYWLVLLALVLIAGITAISALNFPGNYKFYTVLSGSMSPAIKTGSVALVKPETKYTINEVVTFNDTNSNIPTTHRIVAIKESSNGNSYTTKGDANNTADLKPLRKSMILGKVLFSVPYAGYAIEFMKTKTGLLVMIIIAAFIIFNEVTNVKKESSRLLAERKIRKLNPEEKIEEKLDEEIIKVEEKVKKVLKKKKRKKKNV
jgi:signal peptidase